MTKFKHRSEQKELLDHDDIPFEDIKINMHELEIINSRLGGHKITLDGISSIISKYKDKHGDDKRITVCELGSGGGDNLFAILKWAKKNNLRIKCIGVDINPASIGYAQTKNKTGEVEFICGDYKDSFPAQKVDIILCSLFCHHFTDDELLQMFLWMKENAKLGVVINDLHRHPLAYYSIRILTKLFSKSYLVKNDAPISVLRGFKRKELEKLIQRAGFQNFSLKWKWAFRWLTILYSK